MGVLVGAMIGIAVPSRKRWQQGLVTAILLGGAVAGIQLIGIEPIWVYALVLPIWTVIALIDYHEHRIPDPLSWGSAATALVGLTVVSASVGSWARIGQAVLVAAVVCGMATLISLVTPQGWGDVKLSISIGLLLGWQGWAATLWGVLGALTLAGIWAVALILVRRRPDTPIALAPPWLVGALGALILFNRLSI